MPVPLFRIGFGRMETAPTPENAAVLVSGLSFLAATWAHVRSERLAATAARWFLGEGEEALKSSPLAWVGQ